MRLSKAIFPDEINTMMGRNTGQFGPEKKHGGIVGDPDEPKTHFRPRFIL